MITTFRTLGLTLLAMRKYRKLTLKEVAAGSGISISYLSEIERSETFPSFFTLEALTDFYGESLHIIV